MEILYETNHLFLLSQLFLEYSIPCGNLIGLDIGSGKDNLYKRVHVIDFIEIL